jgi:putative acetyltransferase
MTHGIHPILQLRYARGANQTDGVFIRRETTQDHVAVRAVIIAAFARPEAAATIPSEATLVDELRSTPQWLPGMSLVATTKAGELVGHVVCTRGKVDTAAVLGLGPLSVRPDQQRRGVGQALVHAVLGAADALDEPLVALLGSPDYYSRFGFRLSHELGITPPQPEWQPHFQVRVLTAYTPALRGTFSYPEPFDRV